MKGQGLRHREVFDRWARQQCWRPDSRDGGLDAMLAALCVAVPVVAMAIVWWGGAR